jgi:hypothetical protein
MISTPRTLALTLPVLVFLSAPWRLAKPLSLIDSREIAMTTTKNVLLACVFAIGYGTGIASAAPPTCPPGLAKQGKCPAAPEIDAGAGVQGLAVLSGILLLVGERVRRRHGG